MLAKDIAAEEEATHTRLLPHLAEKTLAPGLKVFAFNDTFRLRGYFFATATTKKAIALHFTAGFVWGDIDTLTQKDFHVSVPYVVARNGRIYELFSPEHWSFHLGTGTIGGNERCSKQTIGIEISNVGQLSTSGNSIRFGSAKYCDKSETGFYTTINPAFRGETVFATFTDAQYGSVKALLRHLTTRFSIPGSFMAEPKRYKVFAAATDAQNYSGIASHVNYRPSGKWDIGPAFKWDAIA
jgi:N-acetylmuramoyl-L-alanine amidase